MSPTFEEFATDHGLHVHCAGCGQCLLDPDPWVQATQPTWCVTCALRLVRGMPKGVPLPFTILQVMDAGVAQAVVERHEGEAR